MAKNNPMLLTLPDIGEGGDITPGKNTAKAIAELLSARGQVSVAVRPVPNEDRPLEIHFALNEVSMRGSSIDDRRGDMGVRIIIEGRDDKYNVFTAATEFYLSDVSPSDIAEYFPGLSKETGKALASLFSAIFKIAHDLELIAQEARLKQGGYGLKADTRTALIEAAKASLKGEVVAENRVGTVEKASDGKLKIRLRGED